jgi:hypothetical protein
MKLANAILRPAKVIEVLDGGKIRAMVPGLFPEEFKDKLPPIYPFFTNHSNSFSEPKVYEDVWVLNFPDNPLDLHWFRKDNHVEVDKEILQGKNVEVLCNREAGMGYAQIYFTDGTGWIIRNEESIIQIRKDGSIMLQMDWPHRTIDINSDNISLGSEGQSSHPAALGDKTQDSITAICGLLNAVSTVAKTNPYTMMISTTIDSLLPGIKSSIGPIASKHVTLD